MLAIKRSAGVASEVNLRKGKETCSKEFTLALNPRADITRGPKLGHLLVAQQSGLMSSKYFLKIANDLFCYLMVTFRTIKLPSPYLTFIFNNICT